MSVQSNPRVRWSHQPESWDGDRGGGSSQRRIHLACVEDTSGVGAVLREREHLEALDPRLLARQLLPGGGRIRAEAHRVQSHVRLLHGVLQHHLYCPCCLIRVPHRLLRARRGSSRRWVARKLDGVVVHGAPEIVANNLHLPAGRVPVVGERWPLNGQCYLAGRAQLPQHRGRRQRRPRIRRPSYRDTSRHLQPLILVAPRLLPVAVANLVLLCRLHGLDTEFLEGSPLRVGGGRPGGAMGEHDGLSGGSGAALHLPVLGGRCGGAESSGAPDALDRLRHLRSALISHPDNLDTLAGTEILALVLAVGQLHSVQSQREALTRGHHVRCEPSQPQSGGARRPARPLSDHRLSLGAPTAIGNRKRRDLQIAMLNHRPTTCGLLIQVLVGPAPIAHMIHTQLLTVASRRHRLRLHNGLARGQRLGVATKVLRSIAGVPARRRGQQLAEDLGVGQPAGRGQICGHVDHLGRGTGNRRSPRGGIGHALRHGDVREAPHLCGLTMLVLIVPTTIPTDGPHFNLQV
mmetsp:Transcript_122266/g.280074  ORF Transcript_122266/g.280074 Transcript_122266/m.280074 type:complete len:519 (-) Transcript_122266:4882-6438(-)